MCVCVCVCVHACVVRVCMCVWGGGGGGGGHTHTNHVPLHPTVEQRSCQEKEEDKVLVWRDHYTAAVLQCLINTSISTISSDSGSTASLTIVAFTFLCSSLLCFFMPCSCAFDTFAHTVNICC